MKHFVCLPIIVAGLVFSSCKPSGPSGHVGAASSVRKFTVQGILRGIDFAGSSVTVEHEDIPDFMPAMTMPFDVKTMAEVEPLKAGQAIEFKLLVGDKSSWIEGVKKIDSREIQLPREKDAVAVSGGEVSRLKEGDRLPEFQLKDSKGRSITRETFAGKPLLLTFIFTRCPIPTFCPLMTNNLRDVREALTAEADSEKSLHLLSISFDSKFDTPEVLSKYASRFTKETDQWRFASGTTDEVGRLTRAFAVTVQPEGGLLNHGLATALVDADGVIRNIWRGNAWKPAEVVAALHSLENESPETLTGIKTPPVANN